MRRVLWIVMTVLATLVAVYAALVLAMPGFGPPFIAERRADMPVALWAHLGGGLVALALGAWQVNARLRVRALSLHRWMGRTYVIAVFVGAWGGLRMATVSQAGMVTHLGFGMLGVLWLWTTGQAYLAIRARDQVRHRRWMIRSYSLTLAAVTLRIYLPLGIVMGVPFGDAYQVISWMCWVPNLIVAEWILRRRAAVVASA